MVKEKKEEKEEKEKYVLPFGKEHTTMAKGILIILMVIHHALADSVVEQYHVQTVISDGVLLDQMVRFCKICISGFAFLSAYGMTIHLKKQKDERNSYFRFMCIRLFKLESSVVFVYILAVFYKRFIVTESIRLLYDQGNGFKPLYMLIDALGMAIYFETPEINITWWYLHFAILLIMTMPFLYMLYKRFRYLLLPAACFLPMAVSSLEVRAGIQSNYAMLLPSVFLGIAFAYEGWFETIKKKNLEYRWLKPVKLVSIILLIKIAFDFWTYVQPSFAYHFVFVIPFAVYEFIGGIPVLNGVLKILGKNATNIFLIHTFIYHYWYTDILYSLKKDWCIIIALVVVCVVVSMAVELLKKISGYNRLTAKMLKGLEKSVE